MRLRSSNGNQGRTVRAAVLALGATVACSAPVGPAGPAGIAGSAESTETNGVPLAAVVGSGSGKVNVTHNARTGMYVINSQDAINVHGTAPNTLLYVRSSADVGLPNGQQADGSCQRAALGFFQPLLSYPDGPPATLETSNGGAGATHVVFGINNPLMPEGARLDIMIRLVDALPPAAPTIDLRTPCFTIEVK